MSAGDEYSASLNFFDQHFSGIRPVEIYIAAIDSGNDMLTYESLKKLEVLEDFLREEFEVGTVYSSVTQFRRLNRSLKRGNPRQFKLPSDDDTYQLIRNYLEGAYYAYGLHSILSPDYRSTMVAAKIQDEGSFRIRQKNQLLQRFLQREFPVDQYYTRITGHALLLDKSNEIITWNLGYGLLTAVCIVALIMGILFRSAKMVLIALIPNMLPLLFVAGLMGYMNIGLNMSTAVIFTIAFGIAVDDTIHFLSRLNTEWKQTGDVLAAIKTTYLSTGKAIMITSLILIFGFGIFLFSAFNTTYMTGLFISVSLLFALFSDLLLLPVLIHLLVIPSSRKRFPQPVSQSQL